VLRSDSNRQAETASVLCAAVSVLKITNTSEPSLSFGKYWMKEQPENEKLAQKFAQGQERRSSTRAQLIVR
jgi:hypothetical protein